MSSADEFQSGGAGASATEPIRAGEVKKGMTVMLKDKPCKVREQSKLDHLRGRVEDI